MEKVGDKRSENHPFNWRFSSSDIDGYNVLYKTILVAILVRWVCAFTWLLDLFTIKRPKKNGRGGTK